MRVFAVSLLTLLFAAAAYADAYGPYRAVNPRAIDGDTIQVDVRLWPGLQQKTLVRLDGVDAPELKARSECEQLAAVEAKQFVTSWLDGEKELVLVKIRQDKYSGRVVARVRHGSDDLSEALIRRGLARPYNGGKRAPWC